MPHYQSRQLILMHSPRLMACRCGQSQSSSSRPHSSHERKQEHAQNVIKPKSLFIFGINGYTSSHLCHRMKAKGWSISGTVRNISRLPSQPPYNWQVYEFDPGMVAISRSSGLSSSSASGTTDGPLSQEGLETLSTSSHVLLSIPPLGLPRYDPVLQEQLKLLDDFKGGWLGYLSSTSVYGDWGGEMVDEEVIPRPGTAKGIQVGGGLRGTVMIYGTGD